MTSLRGSAAFRRALEHGERYSDNLLALRALRRPAGEADAGIRIGTSVGRRFGNAVQRNRVRRWVRESARVLLKAQGAWDLVFIPRGAARLVAHDQLRESISRLLQRAGISGHDA